MSEMPTPTDAETETQRATAALIGGIDARAPASLHYAVRELTDRAPRPQRAGPGVRCWPARWRARRR